MTNLERWLWCGSYFIIPYIMIMWGPFRISTLDTSINYFKFLPIVLVITFGIYAAGIVLLRTLNFNECPEAAKQLQVQIKEARADLVSKGFKFRE